MTRRWFTAANTADLDTTDLAILNRATRHLVDDYNLSPTERWLMEIRTAYRPGFTARDIIEIINDMRH